MRWLLWLGGVASVAGMWWFLQGVDLFGGPGNTLALAGGGALFLAGLVAIGFGLRAGVGRE